MRDFSLGRRFGLVFAAFRVFQSLLEPTEQRDALGTIRRHLRPGGLVALDLFDPRLSWLEPGAPAPDEAIEVRHPVTGRRVRRVAFGRENDPLHQRFTLQFRFTEVEEDGTIAREEIEELALRWTYRQELWHLLELTGFEGIAEYRDYAGSPPAYGREIIAVARRPAGRR
jgi:hypothetical protein